MCRPDIQTPLINESLAEKLGKESQLEFLLMNMCENMQEDEALGLLFKQMDFESMHLIMKSLIQAAFEGNIFDDTIRNGIIIKSYSLFERGFNIEHFEKIEAHFESAMLDSWVEPEVIDDCKKRFATLRIIFEEEGKDLGQNAMAHREEFARRIMTSHAA